MDNTDVDNHQEVLDNTNTESSMTDVNDPENSQQDNTKSTETSQQSQTFSIVQRLIPLLLPLPTWGTKALKHRALHHHLLVVFLILISANHVLLTPSGTVE